MGLLDILNGMQNGPRGQRQPSSVDSSSGKGGGMSPIMMALLGLLASRDFFFPIGTYYLNGDL